MKKTAQGGVPTTIDEYIADFPRPVQTILRRVCAAIRTAMPEADELLSYRIPAFKLHGRIAIYFAAWKAHYSLYPSTAALVAAFARELEPYEVNGRGTIRFPFDKPVPVELIRDLAAFRVREVVGDVQAKAAAKGDPAAALANALLAGAAPRTVKKSGTTKRTATKAPAKKTAATSKKR